MTDLPEYPLVTFALFAYNQEKYIREAVEGALAQDYPNLEIILSDDCSPDRTYEIMREAASKYQGPHAIRLNRNIKNLGIAGHVNTLMGLVSTDFVVVAAGDDISEATRTSELVKVWMDSAGHALSIHSSARNIDEDGVDLGTLRRGCTDEELSDLAGHASKNLGVLGATHGWDLSLIRKFQPILPSVINEDVILPARAALLGLVHFIDKPLVRYRQGVGVSHEVARRRTAGLFDLSIPQMKRPYYSFLQKYRDYREKEVLTTYRGQFARSRATAIYPIILRRGRVTPVRIIYFIRRCRMRYLLWELIKFKSPWLIALKQKVQFR